MSQTPRRANQRGLNRCTSATAEAKEYGDRVATEGQRNDLAVFER